MTSGELDLISEEGAGNSTDPSRQSRRSSQGSLHVPTSPTSSLSLSPRLNKKRRMAQSRRSKVKSDTDREQGGAGENAGTGAEGLEQVGAKSEVEVQCPLFQKLAY